MQDRLVFLSLVVVVGIAAQWLAWRLRLPSILLLLAAGYVVGYAGFDPDSLIGTELLFPAVSIAVSVILLEGGLTLQFKELKDATGQTVARLVTVGVAVAWILTGIAAHYLLGMHWRVAALTGAVLVVTGPTVVAPLLRYIRPSRRISSILKWEGIVIDPIGAILAVLTYEALFAREESLFLVVFKVVAVGFGVGLLTCRALLHLLKRYWIPDFLHSAVILAAGVGTFTLSNLLAPESGLITVTVLGIALANQKHVPVSHILEFKENLRVLLISSLFMVLAARIQPAALFELGWGGFAFLATLILVIRPLSVFVATLGSELTRNERIFISFLAPRGIVAAAVSSVFALEVQQHSEQVIPGAQMIVPITFLVIVGTVATYGLGAAPLANALDLSVPHPQGILFAGASEWVRRIAKLLAEERIPVVLVDTNFRNVAEARMMGLRAECGSIVSEFVSDEMDLAGVGRLLAVTPNDDLNSLAAMEFAHLFGRQNVYQLRPWIGGGGHREVSPHMRGRLLFDKSAMYHDLAVRMRAGADLKKTKITADFSYSDFLARYGKSSLPLFILDHGVLTVCTDEGRTLAPKPGQTIIALVDDPRADRKTVEVQLDASEPS